METDLFDVCFSYAANIYPADLIAVAEPESFLYGWKVVGFQSTGMVFVYLDMHVVAVHPGWIDRRVHMEDLLRSARIEWQ